MSGQLSSTAGNFTPSHSAATPTAQHSQVQGRPARANSANSPRSTAKPPVAQQTPGGKAKANQVPFTYRLRHYRWRTFLSIAGPLIVLGFYCFICFNYLDRPAQNNVLSRSVVDARWIYYVWFLIGILILDWARSGICNVEAAALMKRRFAPNNAKELFWHADQNWGNILWWLRGLREVLLHGPQSGNAPAGLWWLLALNSMLLWVAIPLSGISMDFSNVSMPSNNQASILGPTPQSFGTRMLLALPQQIRANWRSGRPTTPSDASILYAPYGTKDVSLTYYNDRIHKATNGETVTFFAGPATNELLRGNAWGMEASISCEAINQRDLTLFKVNGFNDYKVYENFDGVPGHAYYFPANDLSQAKDGAFVLPNWAQEIVNDGQGGTAYSLILGADGITFDNSPYYDLYQYDPGTINGLDGRMTETTTALFEAYLWQGQLGGAPDPVLNQLLHSKSDIISTMQFSDTFDMEFAPDSIDIAGFGVSCRVKTAVGNATLDPNTRTYADFALGTPAQQIDNNDQTLVYGVQTLAVAAIGIGSSPDWSGDPWPSVGISSLLAAQLSIGAFPYNTAQTLEQRNNYIVFNALTPANFGTSMYKLLGEAVIAAMGSQGQPPWQGNLLAYDPVKYLSTSVIPWQLVLALLAVWTVFTLSITIPITFTKRWAPSLQSFEFFRFGAQYAEVVSGFESTRFEHCDELERLPGLVGVVSGGSAMSQLHFLGLSEVEEPGNAVYTFDRDKARKGLRR